MAVPRLVLVADSPRGYGLDTDGHEQPLPTCFGIAKTHLIAADAVFGKLVIVAGAAVNVAAFGEEALRSYWPFAAVTGETLVVPGVSFVLHSLCAWKNTPDVMNNEIRGYGNKSCQSVEHLPEMTSFPARRALYCVSPPGGAVLRCAFPAVLRSMWHL